MPLPRPLSLSLCCPARAGLRGGRLGTPGLLRRSCRVAGRQHLARRLFPMLPLAAFRPALLLPDRVGALADQSVDLFHAHLIGSTRKCPGASLSLAGAEVAAS